MTAIAPRTGNRQINPCIEGAVHTWTPTKGEPLESNHLVGERRPASAADAPPGMKTLSRG